MTQASQVLRQVKEVIRSPYAWPGGYPLYVIMADGEALSVKAAKENWREIVCATLWHDYSGWRAEGVDVNWEDPDLFCCHSGERIESAYAEDDAT
jgi:hypothetical protein